MNELAQQKPKTALIKMRISPEERELLEKAAEKCGYSLSAFVRLASTKAAHAVLSNQVAENTEDKDAA